MLNFKLVKYENRLGARHFIQIRLPPCFIVTQLSFHCDPALTAPTLRLRKICFQWWPCHDHHWQWRDSLGSLFIMTIRSQLLSANINSFIHHFINWDPICLLRNLERIINANWRCKNGKEESGIRSLVRDQVLRWIVNYALLMSVYGHARC